MRHPQPGGLFACDEAFNRPSGRGSSYINALSRPFSEPVVRAAAACPPGSSSSSSIYDVWTKPRRYAILSVVSLASIMVPLCDTIYLPALPVRLGSILLPRTSEFEAFSSGHARGSQDQQLSCLLDGCPLYLRQRNHRINLGPIERLFWTQSQLSRLHGSILGNQCWLHFCPGHQRPDHSPGSAGLCR